MPIEFAATRFQTSYSTPPRALRLKASTNLQNIGVNTQVDIIGVLAEQRLQSDGNYRWRSITGDYVLLHLTTYAARPDGKIVILRPRGLAREIVGNAASGAIPYRFVAPGEPDYDINLPHQEEVHVDSSEQEET